MRYAITGTERCLVWKSRLYWRSGKAWAVVVGNNGCPLNYPVYFATWREAMTHATGAT